MKLDLKSLCRPVYLGLEAGGTRTVALLEDRDGTCLHRIEAGPGNLRLLDDARLAAHFQGIASSLARPDAIAIGMAGVRTEADRQRVRKAATLAWPGVPCHVTNDLETALAAAEPPAQPPLSRSATAVRHPNKPGSAPPRILVLSGTGSCCFGLTAAGRSWKVGGWGHILGDKGSGFEIGLRALKAVVYYYDRDGKWPKLGERLLTSLQLNEPDDLIDWVQRADKGTIAALAPDVFLSWSRRDPIATDILKGAADSLARDAVSCASRLAGVGAPARFIFAGGVLLGQPRFAQWVRREIGRRLKAAEFSALSREGAAGAIALARRHFPALNVRAASPSPGDAGRPSRTEQTSAPMPLTESLKSIAVSPTERRNPRSMRLDRMEVRDAIEMMLREERRIAAALLARKLEIEQAVRLVVKSFRQNGRLFYVGAGTSGRLGVLDASECPPTFGTAPEQVQGILAGGQQALWQSVEGAEDDSDAGARALAFRGVTRRDTVVGIAASGRTPFVWGALREAKRRGASTVLLCFNPTLAIARSDKPTLVIAPDVGPEVLTGSTRLKAGTATKLVLNILTTLSMVRLGKVVENLMVDVKAANAKLKDRAVRILRELTGASQELAEQALCQSGWNIKAARRRLGREASRAPRHPTGSRAEKAPLS